jgi:transmembrane sensor
MSKHNPRIPAQIVDEASEWFVLMRDPAVALRCRENFAAWLRTSPVNVAAYIDIAKLWGDAAHVSPDIEAIEQGQPEALATVSSLTGNRETARASRESVMPMGEHARDRARSSFKLVAGVVIVVGAGLAAWLTFGRATTTYSDGIGEQRQITLEDNSRVHLDSKSRFTVRFSAFERRIDLLEGRALFEVAHSAARPFIVYSGGVAVRAVGTQFDVNSLNAGTVVTVVEGRVSLEGASTGHSPLTAGERATIDRQGQVALEPNVDLAAATSWLQSRLDFQNAPLSEIVEEFNRYNRTPIILTDPSLGNMRVSAVFRTTDTASLLRFLGRVEGIQIEHSQRDVKIRYRQ